MFNYLITREQTQTNIQFNIHNPQTNERIAILQYWFDDNILTIASKNRNGYDTIVNTFQDIFEYCVENLTNSQKIIAIYIARTIGIDC